MFVQNAFAFKYLLVLEPSFTGGAVYVSEETNPQPGQQGEYIDPVGGVDFISGTGSEWDGVPVRVYTWMLVNGFFGLFLCFGFFLTTTFLSSASDWHAGSRAIKSFISQFAPLFCLLIWVVVSFIPQWAAVSLSISLLPPSLPRQPSLFRFVRFRVYDRTV